MYNKALIERIKAIFAEKLSTKTGWGKNEVIILHNEAIVEAVLELVDNE